MSKILPLMASAMFLISCAAVPGSVSALEKPNILIMGEDADTDTVPRNGRVFNRVLNALSNQLHDNGFNVYDETAVTLRFAAQGRVRRTDAEIIDIARSVDRPPIDVVVIFQIYASAEELSYLTKVRTRITGRVLLVTSGQRLGNFEVESPQEWAAPVDCPRECILEFVGANAKILAQDLGNVLVRKISPLFKDSEVSAPFSESSGSELPNAYTIVFANFCDDKDVLDVEEYLVAFSGYRHYRPIRALQCRHEYWYETHANTGRLLRNLKKMMDILDIDARVTFSGGVFTAEKITSRN